MVSKKEKKKRRKRTKLQRKVRHHYQTKKYHHSPTKHLQAKTQKATMDGSPSGTQTHKRSISTIGLPEYHNGRILVCQML